MNVRPMTEADRDRVFDLRALAFNMPESARQRHHDDLVLADNRVAEDRSGIVGTLKILRFAHYFGGNAVPAAGVAAVAIAPDARGRGVGSTLMNETLRDLRAGGSVISSLYPATAVIYRRCGYGFGGVRTFWQAALSSLPSRDPLALERFDTSALDDVAACYARIAATENGLVRRDTQWWQGRVMRSAWDDAVHHGFLVREAGEVTGWIIYRPEASKDDWRHTLQCRDLFWTTANAARALLSFAANHRSTAVRLRWAGPATEPIADLLAEDTVEIDSRFRFMIRLLDVPTAIEARGYPLALDTSVTIGVRDSLFDDNGGPWRIEVSGGSAKVEPAESADATADVSTWAGVWSGLTRAPDAVRLGGLEATPAAIEALEAIFAGPIPWLADFY